MAVFHQNVILPFCFVLQIPQTTVDTIINQENDPCFDSRHQAQHNRFVRGVTDAPRDKCAHFREINGIAAAFQYSQKNYIPTALSFL